MRREGVILVTDQQQLFENDNIKIIGYDRLADELSLLKRGNINR